MKWKRDSETERGGVVRLFFVALMLLVGSTCTDTPEQVSVTVSGDTTWVRIPEAIEEAPVAEVEVLWQDDDLDRPTHVLQVADRLFVADRTRIHVVTVDGEHLATAGRDGQGPTEFGSIAGLGLVGGEVVALDVRNARYATLDSLGAVVATRPSTAEGSFMNPHLGDPSAFQSWDGGIVQRLDGNLGMDGWDKGISTAVVWASVSEDSVSVLRSWDGFPWMDAGYFVGPESAYPAQHLIAIGDSGRVAWSDGVEACISLFRLADEGVVRSCREGERFPVSAEMRRIAPEVIDASPDRAAAVLELAEAQSMPDLVPSFDRLRYGEDGRIWARVLGADAPRVHPTLARDAGPDVYPETRLWEAVDQEGRPAGRVRLPRAFEPRVFTEDRVYGLWELPTGEQALARAVLR